MGRKPFLLAFVAALATVPAFAHGDVRQAIALLSELIAKYPDESDLYAKRGELHRQRMDWPAALADFDRALELKPELVVAMVGRGQALLGSGRPEDGVTALDRCIERVPENLLARLVRARALARSGRHMAAAEDFDFVLARTPNPQPEYYFERATALLRAGDHYAAQALGGLDEGISALGPIVTLQLMAIDLELKVRAFDRALARLDTVAAQAERKESWLARRGEILEIAARPVEARAAYAGALAAIATLPDYRHSNRAVKALEMKVREAWARLSTRASGGTQ